jgi:hypothetical protein
VDVSRLQNWAPLAALALTAGLNAAVLWKNRRRTGIPSPPPAGTDAGRADLPEAQKASPAGMSWGDVRDRVRRWIRNHTPEVSLIVAGVLLAGYIFALSPNFWSLRSGAGPNPENPYSALHYVRTLELKWAGSLATIVAVVGTLLGLACFVYALRSTRLQSARFGLLLSGLSLLGLWQLAMLDQYPPPASAPLALGLLVLLAWGLDYRRRDEDDLFEGGGSRATQFFLFSVALAVTILGRVSYLRLRPLGIEGDEMKWTVEVARSMVDHQFLEAAEYHLASLPVSFYLEALPMRVLGVSALSARSTTVLYSILAGALFYFLARRLAGPRVAWLATFLLGISLLDMSASRLANVESLVKIWPIAGLLTLGWAFDARRTVGFVAAGVLVGLGMLAYDTVAPLLISGLVLLVYELRRLRIPRPEAIRFAAAYAAPQILVLPIAATYWIGRLQYYELDNKGLQSQPLPTLLSNAQDLWQALFTHAASDFLYNRDGPLFESLLSPWLLCGLVLAILLWNRGRLLWALVVLGTFFLPVPIAAHSPMGRVLYPGLPMAYFLMAIAIVSAEGELRRLLGKAASPALMALGAVLLIQLFALHQFIYFNEVSDPDDRLARRELYDLAAEVQRSGALGIFPYVPTADDPIESEQSYAIWLGMRSTVRRASDMQTPMFPAAPTFLASLSELPPSTNMASVVWYTASRTQAEERKALLDLFLRCYPTAHKTTGRFFDLFTLDTQALTSPACVSAMVTAELAPGSPDTEGHVDFEWGVVGAPPSQATLDCGRESPELQILQAETMAGPGWVTENRFADDFQGEGFLADPGDNAAAPASTEISVPKSGDYFVWVRSYRRVEDPYGAILDVNGQTADFALAFSGQPTWAWERLGPFRINEPEVTLSITRPYGGSLDHFMALFFDSLVITTSETFDPNTDPPYIPAFSRSVQIQAPDRAGRIAADLLPGTYACTITVQDGGRMIDSQGGIGVRSSPVLLTVGGDNP